MMYTPLLDSGLMSVKATHGETVAPLSSVDGGAPHQFLVLLKPELLESTVDVPAVWVLVSELLERASVSVLGVRWFTGEELRESGTIERHYGVINDISRRGVPDRKSVV